MVCLLPRHRRQAAGPPVPVDDLVYGIRYAKEVIHPALDTRHRTAAPSRAGSWGSARGGRSGRDQEHPEVAPQSSQTSQVPLRRIRALPHSLQELPV